MQWRHRDLIFIFQAIQKSNQRQLCLGGALGLPWTQVSVHACVYVCVIVCVCVCAPADVYLSPEIKRMKWFIQLKWKNKLLWRWIRHSGIIAGISAWRQQQINRWITCILSGIPWFPIRETTISMMCMETFVYMLFNTHFAYVLYAGRLRLIYLYCTMNMCVCICVLARVGARTENSIWMCTNNDRGIGRPKNITAHMATVWMCMCFMEPHRCLMHRILSLDTRQPNPESSSKQMWTFDRLHNK